ncbi:MAG: hypothetical protein DCC74_10510 [Proteobacteria bacterium]|nr:MAG: hypothetical protein DCC74_10510 [Pseudomonadota bacterium]
MVRLSLHGIAQSATLSTLDFSPCLFNAGEQMIQTDDNRNMALLLCENLRQIAVGNNVAVKMTWDINRQAILGLCPWTPAGS